MMSIEKLMWTMLVLGLVMTTVVRADDAEDEDEDAGEGVSIKTIFPGQEHDVQLTAGATTDALVNFENSADTTYQVEFIRAHLASKSKADHVVQNLTGMLVNRTVNQGESVSMVYKITPVKDIDPRDYGLVLQVHFVSESDERSSKTAFNETVLVNDGSSIFDAQSAFLLLVVVAIAGVAYHSLTGSKKTTATRRTMSVSPTPEAGTTKSGVDMSYIASDHIKATRNRSREGRSKSPKK